MHNLADVDLRNDFPNQGDFLKQHSYPNAAEIEDDYSYGSKRNRGHGNIEEARRKNEVIKDWLMNQVDTKAA